MRKENREPYLRKAERPLLVRPVFILPLSFTLILLALHFFFRGNKAAADFYMHKITRPVLRLIAPYIGKVPFSLTEAGFLFLVFWLIFALVRGISSLYHLPGKRFRRFLRGTTSLLGVVFLLINLFLMFHVLHFSGTPLGEEIGLDPNVTPRPEDLVKYCRTLSEELNKQRENLPENEDGVYFLSDRATILKGAAEGVESAAKRYDILEPVVLARPKTLISSAVFSRMGIAGFFSPFLLEANVNGHQPDIGFPTAALHELGHLHGYAREDDCEFFAFLTGYLHPREDFRYAATFLAWDKLMLELQQRDAEAWRETYALVSPAVRLDIQNRNEYWQSMKGPLSEQTQKINDRFLKISGQESGVKAYNEAAIWILRWLVKEGDKS